MTSGGKRGGKREHAGRPRQDQYEVVDAIILSHIGRAMPNADCLADKQLRRAILILNTPRLHTDYKIRDERTGKLRRISEDDILRADVASEFWENIFRSLIGSNVAAIVRRLRARLRPRPLRLHGKLVTSRHALSPYRWRTVFARPIAVKPRPRK
jgi:hypothetical protein